MTNSLTEPNDPLAEPGDGLAPLVLIVDDSSFDAGLAGTLLQRHMSARIRTVSDGLQALAQMRRELPAVVITDLNMPGMDGLQLVEQAKTEFPNLPIILMTAFGNEDLAMRALRAGAASYVPKENLIDDLATTIESILASSRQERRRNQILECINRVECDFQLENDPALVPHLIAHIQNQMVRMQLCNDNTKIRVGVALEEAMLNAIYHGNLELSSDLRQDGSNRFHEIADERRRQSPWGDRRLHVTMRLARGEAAFVIRDEGPGFDITNLPDPTDPENLLKTSGRGLLLIRTFMDEVSHNASGNQITMVKRVAPAST